MVYRQLNEINASRTVIDRFAGYNHNLSISEGEFYDMKNLSSSNFPLLSPRGKRGIYPYPSEIEHHPNGLISKDNLCYVDGTTLYIDNYPVPNLVLSDSPKQLVSMGAYIVIMPDKKYVNTQDLSDCGDIEASFTSSAPVSYELCKVDGETYDNIIVSSGEPSEPSNTQLWIDTSTTPHSLKQYSTSSAMWIQIATTYVKIKTPGIASAFKSYDGVHISGIDTELLPQLTDLEGKTSIIWDSYHDEDGNGADDFIVMVGILDTVMTQDTPITVARRMPNLDFIVECNNRLWGCRYGTSVDGEIVNEIYASKLGDFKNWHSYLGLTTDSYTASCGTDGQWTGAITHLGYPLFFKENYLHKVYGNYPANFQIQSTACRGVQKGCGKSLAIVRETLFYKGRMGICAYDGSLPSEISAPLGTDHFSGIDETVLDPLRNGAVAGSHHNKYYISMKSDEDGEWYFFVYDVATGLWHKEDKTRVDDFCSCKNDMYFIDHGDKKIKTVFGSGDPEEGSVQWMAETGIIGTDSPDRKTISRVLLRMGLPVGSRVMISAQYDSLGEWEHLATMTGSSLRTFTVPIRPKRCDHFRLRLEGLGEATLYSLTKTIEQGSDIR